MNLFIDFFASLSFYIIPFLIGRSITKNFVYAFLVGSIFLFSGYTLIHLTLSIFGLHSYFSPLIKFFLFSILSISFIKLVFKDKIYRNVSLNLNKNSSFWYFFILTSYCVIIYFFIYKEHIPYPHQLNWDLYEHITLANLIAQGNFSPVTTHLSDTFTFNSYTSIFHTILSIPKTIFKTNLLGVYWWLEFWHFYLSVFASYLITFAFTKKKNLAFLGGIISGLFFESSIVYTNYILIPQTFTALFIVLLIAQYFNQKGVSAQTNTHQHTWLFKNTRPDPFFLISLLAIFLSHFIVGLLGITLILLSKILMSIQNTKVIKIFSPIMLIIASLSFALNYSQKWILTNREEAFYFTLGLYEKSKLILDWYSLLLPIFLLAGIIAIFKFNIKKEFTLLFLTAISLAFSLAPFSYFLKFFVISHYLLIPVFIIGIELLVQNATKYTSVAFFFIFIFVGFQTFFINISNFKEPFYFKGKYSQISDNEIRTAFWLNKNYSKDALIISDPATSYILEAVSEINSPGGAYMHINNRKVIANINNSTNYQEISNSLNQVSDPKNQKAEKIILVLSGRYFAWQRSTEQQKFSFHFNIWTPHAINQTDLSYVNQLLSNPQFKTVYQNDELVIFEFKK